MVQSPSISFITRSKVSVDVNLGDSNPVTRIVHDVPAVNSVIVSTLSDSEYEHVRVASFPSLQIADPLYTIFDGMVSSTTKPAGLTLDEAVMVISLVVLTDEVLEVTSNEVKVSIC